MTDYNFSIADLDDITPGAVFLRPTGTKRFVLFLANTKLKGEKAKDYPQVVVFANDDGDVFSMSAREFLKSSKFHNVEPSLETKLEALFTYKDSDDEELTLDDAVQAAVEVGAEDLLIIDSDEDEDELELDSIMQENVGFGDDSAEALAAVAEVAASHTNDLTEALLETPIEFNMIAGQPMPAVPPDLLAALVVSYSQEPQLAANLVLHKITFDTAANISREDIRSSLGAGIQPDAPSYPTFTLNASFFGEDAGEIDWTHSVGSYPTLINGQTYLTVILSRQFEEPQTEDVSFVETFSTSDALETSVS